MHAFQPGVVSVSFREHSVETILSAASVAGLKSIEWGGDVHVPAGNVTVAKKVGALTVSAGLRVSSYGSYYRAGAPSANEPTFEQVLETALALGAPCIRVWAGETSSAKSQRSDTDRLITDLRRCAKVASAAGVTIATEFHAGTQMDHASSALEILKAVGEPLRTYWQPSHGMNTEQAVRELRAILPWLQNIHVFHWWPTQDHRLPLKNGIERWQKFFRETASLSGERHALLEFMPEGSIGELSGEAAVLKNILGQA